MTDSTDTPPGGDPPEDGSQEDARADKERSRGSRRDFLRRAGFAAAGMALGGTAGATVGYAAGAGSSAQGAPGARREPREPGFEHLVVVMYENRSFDNVLGYLYDKSTLPAGATFDGLHFGDYSNPSPVGPPIPAHPYQGPTDYVMRQPDPDPGEEYPHVNTQIFSSVRPASNAGLYIDQMQPPFNAPTPDEPASMKGFVSDYYINFLRLKRGKPPTHDELRTIMGNFTPQMLPVFSTLASNFAVYDAWHCAVPSQTFCNRSFFNAGTSHGFVTNKGAGGYNKWLDQPQDAAPTIFNRLEDAGVSWRVYYDELQLVSFTGVLHAPVLEKYWKTNFATMEQFYEDVRTGNLPAYSFIEPRMVYNHNDMHPPFGVLRETDLHGDLVIDSALSDARAADALLHEIYTAIKSSDSERGSNAMNTMLFVTFDEHGGTYDHVTPPGAVPPGDGAPGEMGFTFDRLGCRVPAIAISAYTRKNTIVNDVMDHCAVIRTLCRLYGLRALTRRDANAKDIFNAVNLTEPRAVSDWPVTVPPYIPPNPESNAYHGKHPHKHKPLSPPGKGLLGLLLSKYGAPDAEVPGTFGEAYDQLHQHGHGLFGAPRPR